MESQKNNFLVKFFPLIIVFVLVAAIYSCSNNDVVNTGTLPTYDDSILVTDDTGRPLGGDYSDWCINGSGQRSFGPAYPNPTNDIFTVKFAVPTADTISLFFLNGNDTLFLMNKQHCQPGSYAVQSSSSAFGYWNSYRRLYISDKRGIYAPSSGCNNFGDIHFR